MFVISESTGWKLLEDFRLTSLLEILDSDWSEGFLYGTFCLPGGNKTKKEAREEHFKCNYKWIKKKKEKCHVL